MHNTGPCLHQAGFLNTTVSGGPAGQVLSGATSKQRTVGEAVSTPVEVGAQGAFCRHAFLHFKEVCLVQRLGKGQKPLRELFRILLHSGSISFESHPAGFHPC